MALKDLYNYAKKQEEQGKAPAGAKSSLEILVDAREKGIKGARSVGGMTTDAARQEIAAAKTQAVLGKALAGTTDPMKQDQLTSAIRAVAEDLNRKSGALDLQKKKEDQKAAKPPADALPSQKQMAEDRLKHFDEYADFDAASAHDRKRYDDQRKRLQMEADRLTEEDALQRDSADIAAMDEEDRKALEQYAVNRVRDQNLPVEMAGKMPTAETESAAFIAKYGKQRADELAETFMRQENAQLAKQADAAGRKFAEERPVLASATTVPINLMSGIVGAAGQLQGAARATGRYRSLDANETGTALDKFSGAVRDQTAQNIEGDVYDERGNLVQDGGTLRKLGSLAYQGGMSFLDSTARMLVSGGSAGISSAIAASGAFSQGLQKYSAMGATPQQAALAATASAGLEYITEKLPTEQVLKIFHKGGGTSSVKEILKQAFLVEPTGEEVNLFAGLVAEALILGEKSGRAQRLGDLIAGGQTRAEAEKQFWKETFLEAAETYAVSAVAGGLGAGGAVYAGNQVQAGQEQRQQMTVEPVAAAAPATGNTQQAAEAAAAALMKQPEAPLQAAPVTEQQEQLVVDGQQQLTRGADQVAQQVNETGSIKEQIRGSQDKLNAMNPVTSIQTPKGFADLTKTERKNWVIEKLQSTGYQVDRKGFGVIKFAEKQLKAAFKYLGRGSVEEASFEAIPYVLEHGTEISSHPVHKDREYGTVTIAAPVMINGQRGNMAVVVRQTTENFYKVHRILTPDGSVFNLSETTNEAEPSPAGESPETGSLATPISSASESIVSDSAPEVNGNPATESDYYDEFEDFSGGGSNREDFLGRDWDAVGKRNVKAYMYENPEVKPYFQMEAQIMLMELADSTRGERTYNEDVHYESGGEKGWSGTKRDTSDDIAYLLDTAGFSYDQIQKGLEAIVKDNGAENNAASKRIEFILHNRLMNGHNDFYSNERVPASKDYVNLINEKHITTYDSEPVAQDPVMEAAADNVKASASSPLTKDSETMTAEGGQPQTVTNKGGQQVMTGFANRDFRNSNTYMNTGLQSENANIRKGYRQELRQDPTAARYAVKHNADTLAEAQSRTGSPENNAAALQDLLNRDHWTPEDVVTSTLLLDQIMASGDKAAMNALRQKRKEAGTYSGQVAQSFSINNPTMKAADSPATAVDTFRSALEGMKQEETTWSKATGMDFDAWKEQKCEEVDRIGIAIATVEDGDSESMRQIIRQIAQRRGTTAWFGTSQNLTGNAWSILKKLEFSDLKRIANTQLVAMSDDFRARGAGEVVSGLRKQSMLSSLKTFVRNISGNVVGGFADAVSESGAGRMMDAMLSHYTGKRTVGNDLARASAYANAAKEAGRFASLCVELNIPIETDVESSYAAAAGTGSNSKYMGRTFRATGNPAMRALYAYQKYMSYALEVSDKIFEGGTNAAVAESLNRLQGANLTQQDMEALSEFTGNRRTYKNATWEEDGKTHGSELARKASDIKRAIGKDSAIMSAVAETAMPYVNVPMNVAQTGIDYTAGVVKGLGEMVSIIKDAKAGKTIPVERQRQAASDFGRGVTGTAMIAMFASAAAMGALKASNSKDWDKEALAQAEGRSGAQINWSALLRGMNGEDAKWQSGDVISGMDFLEPFNTQMYLGAELAQADDFNLLTYAGSTIKSVWQSLMDSPVMTGLADIEQTLKDVSEAETPDDAMNVAAGYAGDVASSFVPQFVRQTAQNQDGYYRDTRGETALQSAINSFLAAIPGQSQKLPVKYSGLGEVQQRGSAVETFLDPTATKVYQQNEVTTFLDELSGRTGDNGIYPDRQAPMRITVAGREVPLDGSMRETYQKTYGQQVDTMYRSLMGNADFQGFSDELKTAALKEAEGQARKLAMAAVSDYREAPAGSAAARAKEIVNQQVRKQIGGLFTNLDTAREYGYSTEEIADSLDASYDAFQNLSKQTQKEILEQATSDTARYLQARQGGLSTDQYLTAAQRIGALVDAKQPQKLAEIAKQPGLTEDQRVLLGKLYATDAQDKNIDEVKALGYDYEMYTKLLDDHENYTKGTGKKKRTMAHWQEIYGFDANTAKALYEVFS